MKPVPYLAGVAGARALYRWLYQDAIGMLPPPQEGAEPEPLESRTSQAEIAKALGWSTSVVGKELARLVNYKWVRDRRMPRFLGQRIGHRVHLLADIAAEDVTGERGVVTRIVLQLKEDKPTERKEFTLSERGTNRQWDPKDVTGTW